MSETNGQDNVCCPSLLILGCGDTEEHKHLVCGYSKAVISNDTVRDTCIGDFKKCVLQYEEG